MGSCTSSSSQQLIDEINKPENRKFFIEHLNLNKNDFNLSSDVTNKNNSNTTTNDSNKDNSRTETQCSQCKCSCHVNTLSCDKTNTSAKHMSSSNTELNCNELVFKIVSIDNATEENCQIKRISFLINSSKHEIYLENFNNEHLVKAVTPQENIIRETKVDQNKDENKTSKINITTLDKNESFKTISPADHENRKQIKLHDDLSYFYSQPQQQFYDYLNLNEERKWENSSHSERNTKSCSSHKHRNTNVSSRIANDLLHMYGKQQQQYYHHHHHHHHQHFNHHNLSYNEFYQEFENLDDYGDLNLNILGKRSKSKKHSDKSLNLEKSKNSTLNYSKQSPSPRTFHSVNILKDAKSHEKINSKSQQQQQRQTKCKKFHHHQHQQQNLNNEKTTLTLTENKQRLKENEVIKSKQENNYEELILDKNANSSTLILNSIDDNTFENNSKIEKLETKNNVTKTISIDSVCFESNTFKSPEALAIVTNIEEEIPLPIDSSIDKVEQNIKLKDIFQAETLDYLVAGESLLDSQTTSLNREMIHSTRSSSIDTVKDSSLTQKEPIGYDDKINKNNQIEKGLIEEDETRKNSQTSIESGEKLKIQSVVEAVGFLLFPSAGFTNLAFKQLLMEINLFESFKTTFKTEYKHMFSEEDKIALNQRYSSPCEELLNKFFNHLLKINRLDEKHINLKSLQKRLGYLYFKNLFGEFERPLRSIGGTMQNFFSNLNSLHEALIIHNEFGPRFLYLHEKYTGYSPSFRCEIEKIINDSDSSEIIYLNIFTIQERTTSFINNFYHGLIECSGKLLWNLDIKVEKIRNFDSIIKYDESSEKNVNRNLNDLIVSPYIMGYRVKNLNKNTRDFTNSRNSDIKIQDFIAGDDLSDDPNDLLLSAELFKSTYPFTIMIDHSLNIKQVGDGLIRHLGQLMQNGHGSNFLTYFSVESPVLNDITFESMLINHNMNYKLKMKTIEGQKNNQFKDMELKGSILYMKESFCLLFIGSPVIHNLEEMTTRGLYISDIPIHDSTRDIILVGEQTKAQEGLKFRMEKLKKSIVKTHEDIDQEKEKNIELLNMIFPSDIARKLWGGEKVPARSVYNVTLLYSDIVGFTSICSTAQPIEIIEMLKHLYTDFDNYCGLLDIYKIETIGDAYVCAGGLHRPSIYHSQQIAWMSLLMMDSASKNITNKGDTIKSDVLAGIVGFKQPRYCLFGNNCSVANKFESMSEEKRIHVSPISKRLLEKTKGFEFEPRSAEYLPENWAPIGHDCSNEISWFLNSFKHKDCKDSDGVLINVQTALKDSIENVV